MADRQAAAMREVDCVVVGAGFTGIYAVHRMLQLGLTVQCFDAGVEVGGVWNWNRYPGATVDVLSRDYSYSFSEELQQEWEWSMRYSRQPEIQAYQRHVADRFGLRDHIALRTRVTAARFDAGSGRWEVETDRGDRLSARYVLMACGHLSAPNKPEYPGMTDFAGPVYHTGHWPEDAVDLAGKRVAVIGTGSSGIQVISAIAPDVSHLTVFQRTPHFSLPICNAEADPQEEAEFKKGYAEYRDYLKRTFPGAHYMAGSPQPSALAVSEEERNAVYERLWQEGGPGLLRNSFRDIMTSREANETLAEFVRNKIASIVKDPVTAERLKPRGYPIGTKRICLDEGYYATYNRDNVALVDLRENPIERLSAKGIIAGGTEHEVDVVICATGYDAFTGSLYKIDIRGREDLILPECWRDGPNTYLGIAAAGFPNMFILQGPGSPSVFVNVVTGGEQQVDWVADCIAYLRAHGDLLMEIDDAAAREWGAYCADLVRGTLFPEAQSWWRGANIPGKLQVFYAFLGGFQTYHARCREEADNGYPHMLAATRKLGSIGDPAIAH